MEVVRDGGANRAAGPLSIRNFEASLSRALQRSYPGQSFSQDQVALLLSVSQRFKERNGRLPNPDSPQEFAQMVESYNALQARVAGALARGQFTPAANLERALILRDVGMYARARDSELRGEVRGERVQFPPRRRDEQPVVRQREERVQGFRPRVEPRTVDAPEPAPRARVADATLVKFATDIYQGRLFPEHGFTQEQMRIPTTTGDPRTIPTRRFVMSVRDRDGAIDEARAFADTFRDSRKKAAGDYQVAIADFHRRYAQDFQGQAVVMPRGSDPAKWDPAVRNSDAYRAFYNRTLEIRRQYVADVRGAFTQRNRDVDLSALERSLRLS